MLPWYAGKVEVANYLKELNKDKKVSKCLVLSKRRELIKIGH